MTPEFRVHIGFVERRAPNLHTVPPRFTLTRLLLRMWHKEQTGQGHDTERAVAIAAVTARRRLYGIPPVDD